MVLSQLTEAEADELLHDWSFVGRPNQQAPEGDWRGWLLLAGRGFGKTRTGAEWVRSQIKAGYGHIGVIAPTLADLRDVAIDGPVGIRSRCWARDRDHKGNHLGLPVYEPSKRYRLTWANGATVMGFCAEEPERLRGPQHDKLWCDELAGWPNPVGPVRDAKEGDRSLVRRVWDMAMFGLRLGDNPQVVITTTPKPIPLIKEKLKDPTFKVTRGSTYDNRANLARAFFSDIIRKHEGTRLGRQELNAEVIDEIEGALWTAAMIDTARVERVPDMRRVVVAIDPAVTTNQMSNLTGIIVAGLGVNGHGYVLRDASGKFSPGEWARKAIALYDEFQADRIVAEGNQGGEMVRHTIQSARGNVPITIVHATRGKQARAEPVAALYEQNRVKHVGVFSELEDQLCTWEPLTGQASPDRLDALTWAITNLMLDQEPDVAIVPPFVSFTESTLPY